ncbi:MULTISPECIES: CBS domain-containing protein [Sphingomonas]|uniref:CBS domain-containing protein n=1 Tax=Sphingomonas TaxID=13687 RepID=UPI000DEEC1E8|nr:MULTISPECIES: CBS domain-containing protein [Sphingomonas]
MTSIDAVLAAKGREVATIAADARLADAAAELAGRRIGALVVVDRAGRIAGMVSERDLVRGLAEQGAALLDQPVATLMTSEVVTVAPDVAIFSALGLITKRRIRHLPVVDGESLIGIVSIGDLVKHRMEQIEGEAAAMRDYIQSA